MMVMMYFLNHSFCFYKKKGCILLQPFVLFYLVNYNLMHIVCSSIMMMVMVMMLAMYNCKTHFFQIWVQF